MQLHACLQAWWPVSTLCGAATHAADAPHKKERDMAKQVLARPCSGPATERTVGKLCRHRGWLRSPGKASLQHHPKTQRTIGPTQARSRPYTHTHTPT